MKKVISLIIVIIGILFILTGCTKNVSKQDYAVNNEIYGTVIEKFFVPHLDYITNEYIDGKTRTIEVHEPDKWYLRIQREEGKDILQTDILVSEEMYNKYNVEDYYGGE